MRALTVRQPYADAIVWGGKTTENRIRPLSAFHLGTRILIHAAKAPHASNVTAADLGLEHAPDVRGAIIGTGILDSCHQSSADGCCSPWGMMSFWHWTLRDVQPLPQPVAVNGHLGLWTLPEAALRDVWDQLLERTDVKASSSG
ncbi:hypothetical protein [Streptomyces sp. NPDC051079]|uniref:hypothetical protein n=1 Tax=Streptomyces sp. NPDC051079 TaxID=3155043 RepID=UPI00345095BF